jgi:hypothetical protein
LIQRIEDQGIDWICSIPPEKRRRWAFRLVLILVPAEILTHIGMVYIPDWFFKHVIMLISFGALYYTGFDYIATTDVRVEAVEDAEQVEGAGSFDASSGT